MYVIGERINGMFQGIRKAIEEQDKTAIQEMAMTQLKAGANILDVNVGPAKAKPIDAMKWLIETIREVTDAPLAVDNPKWEIQSEVIPMIEKGGAVINSCKADPEELMKYLELAVEYDAGLVALLIDQNGVPSDVDKRVELGATIGALSMDAGLSMDKLFIDPIILPVNVAPQQPEIVMESIRQLRVMCDPPPHFVLGLSNVSQKCANRSLINQCYVVMAMTAGLDAAIMDPNDADLMNAAITAELLQEKMIYCDSYLDAYRMSQ